MSILVIVRACASIPVPNGTSSDQLLAKFLLYKGLLEFGLPSIYHLKNAYEDINPDIHKLRFRHNVQMHLFDFVVQGSEGDQSPTVRLRVEIVGPFTPYVEEADLYS